MVDETACKSFVQHREFLALKAQKRAAESDCKKVKTVPEAAPFTSQ